MSFFTKPDLAGGFTGGMLSGDILKGFCIFCCSALPRETNNSGKPTHSGSSISMLIQHNCFVVLHQYADHIHLSLKHQWSSKKIINNTFYEMKALIRFCFRCETCSWDLLWESQFCWWSLWQLWQRFQELLCQMWTQVWSLPANMGTDSRVVGKGYNV